VEGPYFIIVVEIWAVVWVEYFFNAVRARVCNNILVPLVKCCDILEWLVDFSVGFDERF